MLSSTRMNMMVVPGVSICLSIGRYIFTLCVEDPVTMKHYMNMDDDIYTLYTGVAVPTPYKFLSGGAQLVLELR